MLSNDFPPHDTVFYYFNKWKQDGSIEQITDMLHGLIRKLAGKAESPSVGIIDSRSVKSSHHVDVDRGIDGNKKIKGRKVSRQSRLKELNLPTSQYYHSKRKYLEQEMHQSTFKSRQEKSYPIIKEFEEWIRTNLLLVRKGTPIEKAMSYAYTYLPRLSRYVLDGTYLPDNNLVENAIRPLAAGVDPREWLSDVLNKSYDYQMNKKDFNELLPHNWKQE